MIADPRNVQIWEKQEVNNVWEIGKRARFLFSASVAAASIGMVDSHASAAASWQTPGWQRVTPIKVGLDERALDTLDADLASGKYGLVDSFQIFRCGEQAFERKYAHDYASIYGKEAKTRGPLNARLSGPYNYFDPEWHPYYKGTGLHTMQSVSKTVTSIIFGIAMTRGDFKGNLTTPVLTYFDVSKIKNVDERKRRMTLENVLTMTTGIEWDEDVPYDDPRSDSSLMEATDDWVQYVMDKPMAKDPGTVFNYSSGATELLAYIFKKDTGQDIDAYGEKYLFAPLGIKHHWKRTYLGVVDTEGGLYLAGGDLAKLGYLYLHGGMWADRRIVSEEWVKRSTTSHVDTGLPEVGYGFQWWLYKNGKQPVWMALGIGGQRLFVFPESQMIATITGWDILRAPTIQGELELINRLLPLVRAGTCPVGAR